MKILIVGSGGREHALAWKLRQSPRVTQILAAPGNPGIGDFAECVAVAADDIDGLVELAKLERPHLVIVGPEVPLVLGLADRLRAIDVPVFGPSARAASFLSLIWAIRLRSWRSPKTSSRCRA